MSFAQWLKTFEERARDSGISENTLRTALSNARFVMVPTQEQDTSLLTPLTALFEAALPFLNLAAFFVPLVGELLLFGR